MTITMCHYIVPAVSHVAWSDRQLTPGALIRSVAASSRQAASEVPSSGWEEDDDDLRGRSLGQDQVVTRVHACAPRPMTPSHTGGRALNVLYIRRVEYRTDWPAFVDSEVYCACPDKDKKRLFFGCSTDHATQRFD